MHCCTQCPQPYSRTLLTHTSTRDSWTLMGKSGSVSCGVTAPFSWFLVLFVPSRSLSPQFYVSSGGSMVGLMAMFSKRAYAIPRSTASRAPAPAEVHYWHIPLQETLKHNSSSVPVGSLCPGAHEDCLSPPSISGRLLTTPKPLTVWITTNCGKFLKRWEYQTIWPASWEICVQVKKQQLELDMEQQIGSKSGKEYVKAVLSPCLFNFMQSTSWETLGWMKHKLESRLPGKYQ